MCKARFHIVTRLRDQHLKRFRGSRRGRPNTDGNFENPDAILNPALAAAGQEAEEEEPEGARAVCLHCGDGGSADRLMLCDGAGCENVRV